MPYSPPQHRPSHIPTREQARKQANKDYNKTQRVGDEFYQSRAWKRVRAWHIKRHPVCVVCAGHGRATIADVVDHIVPIKQGGDTLNGDNLQSLCHLHHNQKSARERQGKPDHW